MSEWIKFTGSDEQIEQCRNAHNGWFIKTSAGEQMYCGIPAHPFTAYPDLRIDQYLICEPHPHADMIIEWARTGRPVYVFDARSIEWVLDNNPSWHEDDKYSFNPPKEVIRYKRYLCGCYSRGTTVEVHNEGGITQGFIRWIDEEWQEVEV